MVDVGRQAEQESRIQRSVRRRHDEKRKEARDNVEEFRFRKEMDK